MCIQPKEKTCVTLTVSGKTKYAGHPTLSEWAIIYRFQSVILMFLIASVSQCPTGGLAAHACRLKLFLALLFWSPDCHEIGCGESPYDQ